MVQVIPRTIEKKYNWINLILPWLSLLLTVLVILGVFFFSTKTKSKNEEINELTQELKSMETEEIKKDEADLKAYKNKVVNVVNILGDRHLTLPLYKFLESLVHPKVYFTNLSLNMETGEANLCGISADFQSLGQQVDIFEKDDFIYSANVQSVFLAEEEGISFELQLKLFVPEQKK
jgi:Tfp pilus assembly protein PilN